MDARETTERRYHGVLHVRFNCGLLRIHANFDSIVDAPGRETRSKEVEIT
jgi:hypothetical protein